LTPDLRAVAHRIVRLLDEPDDIPVLAPLLQRELLYHVLRGPQGAFVRALAVGSARHRSIDGVLRALHADCSQPVAVAELARRAGMSETTFYEAFRTVTGASPLQYVKRLRLLEAHRRLAHGLENVSGAAASVGYTSLSQFSREFTRMFGESPSRVARRESPQARG
jgi:AraC-like DNA-binding protein